MFATYNEGLTFCTPEFENAVRNKLLNNRLIQKYITNPARLGELFCKINLKSKVHIM
jgi:hypothetical protein